MTLWNVFPSNPRALYRKILMAEFSVLCIRSKMESLYKGMDVAKSQHVAIGKEVHTCLDMGHVINAGSCLYAVIQDVRVFGSNSMNRFRISIDFVIFAGHAGCEILRPSS